MADLDAVDTPNNEIAGASGKNPKWKKKCDNCGLVQPVACQRCKNKECGVAFAKKITTDEYWQDIGNKGKTNVTQQKQKLRYRADILHKQHGYDVVVLYHIPGKRRYFDFYGTPGAARSFLGLEENTGKCGSLVKTAFEKFMKEFRLTDAEGESKSSTTSPPTTSTDRTNQLNPSSPSLPVNQNQADLMTIPTDERDPSNVVTEQNIPSCSQANHFPSPATANNEHKKCVPVPITSSPCTSTPGRPFQIVEGTAFGLSDGENDCVKGVGVVKATNIIHGHKVPEGYLVIEVRSLTSEIPVPIKLGPFDDDDVVVGAFYAWPLTRLIVLR